jgi:hypothetical protein
MLLLNANYWLENTLTNEKTILKTQLNKYIQIKIRKFWKWGDECMARNEKLLKLKIN